MREKVILICSNCLARNYVTTVNKSNNKRLELMKYCKNCNMQTLHKASKQEAQTMGLKKYFAGVIKEGKRVRWPKRDVFLLALVTTLVICVFCALILRLEDLVSGELIKALKEVFKGVKK